MIRSIFYAALIILAISLQPYKSTASVLETGGNGYFPSLECYDYMDLGGFSFRGTDGKLQNGKIEEYEAGPEDPKGPGPEFVYCNQVLGKEDIKTCTPENRNYVSKDSFGYKEVCHTKFPTWGERMIFRRMGQTFDDTFYTVTKSYCPGRNILENWAPCGSSWIDDFTARFEASEINQTGLKRVLYSSGNTPSYHVCVKEVPSGSPFGTKNTKNGDVLNYNKWTKVCAYVSNTPTETCNLPLIDFNYALIGCVDGPARPGPKIYNKIIPEGNVAFVDPKVKIQDLLGLGSKFHMPKVVITHGINATDKLTLTYDYTKTDLDCLQFAANNLDSNEYCAKPHPTDPSQICVCIKGDCAANKFISKCAPRPTPTQSNLTIVGTYKDFVDASNGDKIYPGITPEFVETTAGGELIYVNESKVMGVKDTTSGKYYKIDPFTQEKTTNELTGTNITYKTMPMPNPIPIAREIYAKAGPNNTKFYGTDVIDIYGLKFFAVIPKLENGKMMTSRLRSMYANPGYQDCNFLSFCSGVDCDEISTKDNYSFSAEFILRAGEREREWCANSIVASAPCGPNGSIKIPHDPGALKVLCPGELKNAANGLSICLKLNSQWSDAVSDKDQLCTPLPFQCEAITEPSEDSGYTIWNALTPNTEASGTCDSEQGLAFKNVITVVSPFIAAQPANVTEAEYYMYKNHYDILKDMVRGSLSIANANNYSDVISYPAAYAAKWSQPGLPLSVTESKVPPKRKCTSDMTSTIEGQCVKAPNCNKISIPNSVSGNATWEAVTEETMKAQGGNTVNKKITVTGKCVGKYREIANNKPPKRDCIYNIDAILSDSYKVFHWGDVENPCVLNE